MSADLVNASSSSTNSVSKHAAQQRILAVVFPELMSELVLQRLQLTKRVPLTWAVVPHAVVLTDSVSPEFSSEVSSEVSSERQSQPESKAELDAVNLAAHRLGIRPHQTIGQASAIVENLRVYPLPRAHVLSALQHIAEIALTFGSPVSLQAPDTVWVDISGSSHLFGGERKLAIELTERIKALGHSIRVAVAHGPWLAQAFARHCCFEESGILQVDAVHVERLVAELPIIALPIQREAVAWFSRLGLLSIGDLSKLPASALAARLENQAILDLIRGQDENPLLPYHPEELPCEELFWEDPLESVEPLLFVLKGLSSRLGARLEGRGQAVQELSLTIHYDPSLVALQSAALQSAALRSAGLQNEAPAEQANSDGTCPPGSRARALVKRLSFRFASPLCHAEDLERVIRAKLQRQELLAPALGLSLQATSVTEARVGQLRLSNTSRWATPLDNDPRAIAVLVAELSADLGDSAVGVLAVRDSHLLEKSSGLLPMQSRAVQSRAVQSRAVQSRAVQRLRTDAEVAPRHSGASISEAAFASQSRPCLPLLPTRLFDPPIEVHAPIREEELWVIREQPFIVQDIRFEQRLEEVEWWDSSRIFRDYFRVWLARVEGHPHSLHSGKLLAVEGQSIHETSRTGSIGMEALVYRDRERGRSYLQAIYD